MMRILLIIMLAGIVTELSSSSAGAQSCYSMPADKTGEIQQGRLVQRAIGGKRVYLLRVPTPVCLTARNSKDNVRGTKIIQVYSSNAAVNRSIVRFVGKDVQVTGRVVGALTRHHKAPIVMDLSDIDQI
jgi:hypothetical protein